MHEVLTRAYAYQRVQPAPFVGARSGIETDVPGAESRSNNSEAALPEGREYVDRSAGDEASAWR
jgi:hypothetical protein